MSRGPNVKRVACDRRRAANVFAKFAYLDHVKSVAGAQHCECPRFVYDVDVPIRRNGRGDRLAARAEAFTVQNAIATFRLNYSPQTAIAQKMQPALVIKRRSHLSQALGRLPLHV